MAFREVKDPQPPPYAGRVVVKGRQPKNSPYSTRHTQWACAAFPVLNLGKRFGPTA